MHSFFLLFSLQAWKVYLIFICALYLASSITQQYLRAVLKSGPPSSSKTMHGIGIGSRFLICPPRSSPILIDSGVCFGWL